MIIIQIVMANIIAIKITITSIIIIIIVICNTIGYVYSYLCFFFLLLFLLFPFFSFVPPPYHPLPGPPSPRTALSPDRPKFRSFFPSPTTIFILSSLSWGSSRGILVVFLNSWTLKRAIVFNL